MSAGFEEISLSENFFRTIIACTKDGIIYFEPVINNEGEVIDFTYVFMNDISLKTIKGVREDYIGKSFLDVFPDLKDSEFFQCMKIVYHDKKPLQRDFYISNENFTGWLRNYLTTADNGLLAFYTDVTKEKYIEEQKKITEKHLHKSYVLINEILESIKDPFLVLDKGLHIIYMNKASVKALGGSEDYPRGELLWEAFPALKNARFMERYNRLVKEKIPITFETKSETDYFLVSAFPFEAGVSVYTKNITERILLERKLRGALKEKEVLIKEIHHRVKNNLQIVASILNLQCSYIADPADIHLLQDTQTRVKAMALIHKMLYETDSINRIDLGTYIRDVSSIIFNAYNVDAGTITLHINAAEVLIETNNAVSLGLILNELITNVIKYAFPFGNKGNIRISEELQNENVIIVIEDDGVGFPKDINFRELPSLGMQLIISLVQQLEGSIDLDNIIEGTKFTLVFDLKKLQHH